MWKEFEGPGIFFHHLDCARTSRTTAGHERVEGLQMRYDVTAVLCFSVYKRLLT